MRYYYFSQYKPFFWGKSQVFRFPFKFWFKPETFAVGDSFLSNVIMDVIRVFQKRVNPVERNILVEKDFKNFKKPPNLNFFTKKKGGRYIHSLN